MSLIFRDIYDTFVNTERAIREMGVDIDDALCGTPKCILTEAQEDLINSYDNLGKVQVDLCTLDLEELLEQINDCFECIGFEDVDDSAPDIPAVEAYNNCPVDGVTMTIDDIRRFRIYEYANNMIEVYVVPKADLPYAFTIPNTARKYSVYWDSTNNTLMVKYMNKDASLKAPAGGYTLASIVAELETPAKDMYGKAEVRACAAYNMTNGTSWTSAGKLDLTVDSKDSTYPTLLNSDLKEMLAGFQFRI